MLQKSLCQTIHKENDFHTVQKAAENSFDSNIFSIKCSLLPEESYFF